jgi:hypothetical protein
MHTYIEIKAKSKKKGKVVQTTSHVDKWANEGIYPHSLKIGI